MNPSGAFEARDVADAGPGMREQLDSALDRMVQGCREGVESWFAATLPGLLDQRRSMLDNQLSRAMDSESGKPGQDDPEAFEDRLVARVREILVQGRFEGLQDIGSAAQAMLHSLGLQAVRTLADGQDKVPGGEPLGSRLSSALRRVTWSWRPPAMARFAGSDWRPSFHPPERRFVKLLSPGRWGRRRIVARVRREIAGDFNNLMSDLERLTLGYLRDAQQGLEVALRLHLRQALQQVEGGPPIQEPEAGETDPDVPPEASGCVVCRDVWEALHGFFCHCQGALERDPASQAAFLEGPGFCPGHLWLLERFSSPRGLCGSLQQVVGQWLQRLANGPEPAGSGGQAGGMLATFRSCAACRHQEQASRSAVERVIGDLARGGAAPDLCLQHLPRVLARLRPEERERLNRHTADRVARLLQSMAGFTLKFDACRRDLLTGSERQAHRDSLEWLAGYRELGIWQDPGEA